jgi:hypothetical protein
MLWTSLNPQLKFVAFWSKFFLFVISDNEFINDFTKIYDKISVKFDNIIFLGDLNYDLFSLQKR